MYKIEGKEVIIKELVIMKIKDALDILTTEIRLSRTPKGRIIDDFSKQNLQAVIDDVANHEYEVVRCKNCGMVGSALLVTDNCPNCGWIRFDSNIS